MDSKIDPREVKEHLEFLGYSNITKEQLKDFIRDLKRLIKYEQSKRRSAEENVTAKESSPVAGRRCSPASSSECHKVSPNSREYVLSENHNRLTSTYNSPRLTCNSSSINTETCPRFQGRVDVHVDPGTEHFEADSHSGRSYHPNDYIDENLTYRECDNPACSCCKRIENNQFKGIRKKSQEAEKPIPPPPSFIRSGKCKPSKCDPVALYHYYQSQWSKRPLPGEDPRSDLRWAIRTRLAQQPQQVCQQKVLPPELKQRREWIS